MNRRHTLLVMPTFALALMTGLVGCGEPPPSGGDRSPFREAWVMEVDQDFIHTADDGTAQIFNLTIGGRESNDNFANRGDVVVNFDGPPNRIRIEMRRFTFGPSVEGAREDFDNLSLWAFTSGLGRPQDQDPADDCKASGWQNACEVRVYFDGQSQLGRSGADLRVTLPADYRQSINIITEDNVEDDDYFNRGSVCVSNLFASADIQTESGNVFVSLADNVTPAPKCSPEQISACENWMADDGNGNMVAAPWAPECDCIAVGGGEFGLLAIDNRDNTASNIQVDIPSTLWASITAQNQGERQSTDGDFCEAMVTVPNATMDISGNDFPWQAKFSTNYPGEPAIMGAGFSIQATSSDCAPVAFTEDPNAFGGVGNGDEQESVERGNIEVCSDCIVQTCDELVP